MFRSPIRTLAALPVLVAGASLALAADEAQTDAKGRIRMLRAGGEFHEITTDLAVAMPDWKRIHRLASAREVRQGRRGKTRWWRGTLPAGGEGGIAFEQELTEAGGAVRLAIRVEARQDVETAGVFLFVHVPIGLFAGGQAEAIEPEPNQPKNAAMPEKLPKEHHFLSTTSRGVRITDKKGATRLEIALDRPLPLTMQDGRKWGGSRYDAYFRLLGGKLRKGDSAELNVTLTLAAPQDRRAARLTLAATRKRYRLWGFGGNFCYGVDSPVTRHNVANIRMGYARVGVKLELWEPVNDNASPEEMNWSAYERRDRPGSKTHADFLLAQRLAKLRVPYIASTWRVPEFVTASPGRGAGARNRKLPREKWPEVLECVGSYLLHAKRKYATEPEMFSFNESDIGCFVRMTAEEHRDWNKACGAYLAKLGLKTKMLLADCATARVAFAEPTARDPEAMKHCTALAFHTWHKGPKDFAAWRDLARRLKLPLIAAEVGPDAGAWRDGSFRTRPYFLKELRMYQEILLHAEAQALLEWEYTSDYRMVEVEQGPDGKETVRPTPRFRMIQQFANHTPRPAEALATESDHPKVLFTAFAAAKGGGKALVLHVANVGAARKATLAGLPARGGEFQAVQTTWAGGRKQCPPVRARDGTLALDLAEFSLLTLTAR